MIRPLQVSQINVRGRRRERGVTLFIALIVLVAMTLAGIGMMRSVDTGTIVAGNLGFRQSAANAADQGIQAAYAWLSTPANIANLSNDNLAAGYYSSIPTNEPNWYDPAQWANGVLLNGGVQDVSGNTVSFLIHRMCPQPNCTPNNNSCANGAANPCGSTPTTSAVSNEGSSLGGGSTVWTSAPTIHYRVTAKAVGPRNSIAIVQTLMRQ
jgi:Tfp pilus assembly protein PilX